MALVLLSLAETKIASIFSPFSFQAQLTQKKQILQLSKNVALESEVVF